MTREVPDRNLTPIHAVFQKWRDDCLIRDGSLFSGASLWSGPNIAEVHRAFVDNPDESSESFITKLKGQMAAATPAAQQLMAEMLWALLLFPANITPDTKRQQIEGIWTLSGSSLPTDSPYLRTEVLIGVGSGGPGFNQHRWRELVFLIALAADLKNRSQPERQECLTNYDAFFAWIDSVPREGKRQFRHMLRYFCFPDRVERMSSNTDRRAILAAFNAGDAREIGKWDDRRLDDELLKLRQRLEAASPGVLLDFYKRPWRDKWKADDSLSASIEVVMKDYLESKRTQRFSGQAPMYRRFQAIAELLRKSEPVQDRSTLEVSASAGQGNWADVPWVAIADKRETTTTRRGVYCVYLFREDMSGVYLTLNQGVTQITEELRWKAAESQLRETVVHLRSSSSDLEGYGFSLTDNIDLRAHGDLGQMYEVSTIAHKFYEGGKVPDDDALIADLDHVLEAYGRYTDSKTRTVATRSAWIFQANKDYFDLPNALANLHEMTWVVRQYRERIHNGDMVFLWQSGSDGGVVALATVLSEPSEMEQIAEERQYNIEGDRFAGRQLRVRIRVDGRLTDPIRRSDLQGHPILSRLTILTGPQGSNFLVTPEQEAALKELLRTGGAPPPAVRKDLKAVCESFAAALKDSHVSYGQAHLDTVRSFVAGLATKRFAILTGLSGSGKTQLALQFGEWLGEDRSKVVPVRPDWTGAEALFGYEDALQPAIGGRRAWNVPLALKFMLDAAGDPYRPYLLVLDEMNLAHVERYFADVLSGIETDDDCLPNLRDEGGSWRIPMAGPERRVVPRNLIVVGTVNVDETTYMFSPKVLDRANTFEFRVRTEDFLDQPEKPSRVSPGEPDLVAGFLGILADDRWHIDNPAPDEATFRQHLLTIHRLLSRAGFEFGHRVFYEAVRFAAMLASAGDVDPLHALDRQLMQKILPRLHGSRRRLEATLCGLAVFCHSLAFDEAKGLTDAVAHFNAIEGSGPPRLPISFDKTQRMIEALRANQFVSFTE